MMHESMQHAPTIAREAKGLTQSLKESLKKHEPWDREIEFQRANLRRQYLQLIFVHPYAKESKDADHSLWMTTSYFNIAAYKHRIAAADAVGSGDNHASGRHGHHGKPSGAVEHRKLVHRFRQFLAEEEKFWTSFVVRVVRVFKLDEARPALSALGIPMSDSAVSEGSSSPNDRRTVFPAEDATSMPSAVQKDQKLIMLSKALVCLGDIARYREHYNESGGRPRAGKDFHDDAKSAVRGRSRRGAAEQPPRPRNYGKAQECYERARLLVPDVGNACHQLAILASYQQDPFASVLQYYRAICVKHPYDTAASNLDNTLHRNLDGYRTMLPKLEAALNEASQSPKLRVERFKKSLVALHGLWKLDPTVADATLPGHAASVMATFSSLVSERVLPTDIIWKTVLLALGALWRFRILRDPNSKRDAKRGHGVIEANILKHVLGIFHTLLQVGNVQLADASSAPEPAINMASAGSGELEVDLAQNITAVFRRTLPALRIGSKWVRVHFGYLEEASSRLANDTDPEIPTVISEFWNSYTTFSSLLGRVFPIEKLPKMTVPLEEDVDVSGFSPLKRAMYDPSTDSPSGLEPGQSQVHPNEEQLMRIADLLEDAVAISKFADSPVTFAKDGFIRNANEPENPSAVEVAPPPPALLEGVGAASTPFAMHGFAPQTRQFEVDELEGDVPSEIDDDNATVSTRTEDDPVSLAMQAELGSDDDDDMDEQVLYPKQNLAPPPPMPPSNTFSTPSARVKPLSPPKPVTAEDLVNEMMRRPRGVSVPDASLPQASSTGTQLHPPLLFGSGSPSAPTSIWSTTNMDATTLSANNLRITGYPGSNMRGTPPTVQALGFRQDQSVPLTPTRSAYGHQRQSSQLVSPTHPGSWASQGSSPLASSQSQPRHTLSPPSTMFAPQEPVLGPRRFRQAPSPPYTQRQPAYHQGFTGSSEPHFSHNNVPPQVFTSNQQPLPSRNTWSYSGTESLNGMGAPLGPFAVPLPYAQPRLQHQTQMSHPGAWAPS